MDIDRKIKTDLKDHLDKTANQIKAYDGWNYINIPEISQKELMQAVRAHGLENDAQTKDFCKFISIGTNFASLDFKGRFQKIPDLVNGIKDLIDKLEQEIKEFSDIASYFHALITSFVKLVMNTKHNMRMALPHLEESVIHMEIMSDALEVDTLTQSDMNDVDIALSNMADGISKLMEHAKSSKEESKQLDVKITDLKDTIESKITVVESRINFTNFLPKIGATLGMVSGASGVGAVVESLAFGGTGALVLGGISFPPIGAILLGAAVGAIGIGSLLYIIIKLWKKHQFKALAYLQMILDQLNKLNSANLAFMNYMNKSEEDSNKILMNIEFFKRNVKNGSSRYRKANADICKAAIGSTKQMISCISEISAIDLKQWIEERQDVTYKCLEMESSECF